MLKAIQILVYIFLDKLGIAIIIAIFLYSEAEAVQAAGIS